MVNNTGVHVLDREQLRKLWVNYSLIGFGIILLVLSLSYLGRALLIYYPKTPLVYMSSYLIVVSIMILLSVILIIAGVKYKKTEERNRDNH